SNRETVTDRDGRAGVFEWHWNKALRQCIRKLDQRDIGSRAVKRVALRIKAGMNVDGFDRERRRVLGGQYAVRPAWPDTMRGGENEIASNRCAGADAAAIVAGAHHHDQGSCNAVTGRRGTADHRVSRTADDECAHDECAHNESCREGPWADHDGMKAPPASLSTRSTPRASLRSADTHSHTPFRHCSSAVQRQNSKMVVLCEARDRS